MRFLGHLDLTRLLLRALRRASISLVYSQGYNPRPNVGFSPALPVGLSSEGEYLDFESHHRLEPETVLVEINRVLPAGVEFEAMTEIRRDLPSLGDGIRAARYRVRTPDGLELDRAVADYQARESVIIERVAKNGKLRVFDLRKEMLELSHSNGDVLRFTIAAGGNCPSLTPSEVLQQILGDSANGLEVVREELLMDCRDQLANPLLTAAALHAG